MTLLWRRHSQDFELGRIAFLSFGLVSLILSSSICLATGDFSVGDREYDRRSSDFHGSSHPNAARGIDILGFQGDANIHEQVETSGENGGELSSPVKRLNERQGLKIVDRKSETEDRLYHGDSEAQLDRKVPSLETEPWIVEAREQDIGYLRATLGSQAGGRQLQQKAEDQTKDESSSKEEGGNPEDEQKVDGQHEDRKEEVKQEVDESQSKVEEVVQDAEHKVEELKTETEGKELQEGAVKEAEKKESEAQPEQKAEKTLEEKRRAAEHYNFPEPYLLGPKITDWDEQRAKWLEQNPHMRLTSAGKPRVLLVTGSAGFECPNGKGDDFYLRSLKLKIDYAQFHGYELFYNLAEYDPLFNGFWVKLPTFRTLLLQHPEIEWIFWLDGDAIFTDLLYEAPLEEFDGYNMIMEGWFTQLQKNSWLAANDGVVLLRNCQWSLDLIDKWSPFGADGARVMYGEMMTEFFTDREANYPADDQAALSYLMIMDEAVMSKILLLESKVQMSAYWKNVVQYYETYLENYHPGLGDNRWPWVTHFTGCSICFRERDHPELKECMDAFQRAYNFADNQMMAYWGFQYKDLSGPELVRIRNETSRPVDDLDVNPWQERIDKLAAASKR